jgi:uncharacterized protein YukE
MKQLNEYIIEHVQLNEKNVESTTITFDFSKFEDNDDVLKSLEDTNECTVEDKEVTVEVTANNANDLKSVLDILQEYSNKLRESPKRSSDEQFAQETSKFDKKVKKLNKEIDKIINPTEEE